jgi:hypothetical protein
MLLQNFQVDSNGISLNWQGHNLDLHNCFNFQHIHYDIQLQQITLTWLRSPEKWAQQAPLPVLKLLFSAVTFFRAKERSTDYPSTEDECLMHISFHPVESRDDFDSIYINNSPTDDLTFYFQSEWGFKINASTVELRP